MRVRVCSLVAALIGRLMHLLAGVVVVVWLGCVVVC
jgi:hypothetical protein